MSNQVSSDEAIVVRVDVTDTVLSYLSGNRGPTVADPDASSLPDYGINAWFDGTTLDMTLTFQTDRAYCCGEWTCHYMLFPSRRWQRLREVLSTRGLQLASRLSANVEVIAEEGTLFFSPNNKPNTPQTLKLAGVHRYIEAVTEAAPE